jgi:hypothetical protein
VRPRRHLDRCAPGTLHSTIKQRGQPDLDAGATSSRQQVRVVTQTTSKSGAALVAALTCWLGGSFPATAQDEPLTEDGCSAAVTERNNTEPWFEEVPGLNILEWNPAQPLQVRGLPLEIKGILCWRSDARFAPNDYVVALAGLPLYIKTDFMDAKRNRTLVLEFTRAGFRIRLLSGPELSRAEHDEMRKLIKHYNAARQQHEAQQTAKSKRPAVEL